MATELERQLRASIKAVQAKKKAGNMAAKKKATKKKAAKGPRTLAAKKRRSGVTTGQRALAAKKASRGVGSTAKGKTKAQERVNAGRALNRTLGGGKVASGKKSGSG